jgi:hypothetical protein
MAQPMTRRLQASSTTARYNGIDEVRDALVVLVADLGSRRSREADEDCKDKDGPKYPTFINLPCVRGLRCQHRDADQIGPRTLSK